MGFGGISIWQLLIILAIVILIFGTKRLKGIGGDLGGAIKSFRKAVTEEDNKAGTAEPDTNSDPLAPPETTASRDKSDTETHQR